MTTLTVSELAQAAGVSVHIVRDHVLRGLVRPVTRSPGGYRLYDDRAVERLRLVRQAFEAGMSLGELTKLFRALDDQNAASPASMATLIAATRGQSALHNVQAKLQRVAGASHLSG